MAFNWDDYEVVNNDNNTSNNFNWDDYEVMDTPSQNTKVLTGGIEQKVIPNWDKKGRIYYTDEQGNRIKSNVPLSRKIGNQLRATGYNIKDWLTTDVGEKAKERRKAVALLTTAPIGVGAGIGGMALSGALGGGLYSGAEQAIEGKFNPKQLATDIGLGAATGGLLGLGGKYIVSPIIKNISRRANIAKRRSTPLAERMTEEQLQNVKQPIEQPQQLALDFNKVDDVVTQTIEKQSEVFYTPWNTEVIKNPTNNQKQSLVREYRRENPNSITNDDPIYRTTYDTEGNEYVWKASDSVHEGMENFLKDKFGVNANQDIFTLNREYLEKYRSNPEQYSIVLKQLQNYENDIIRGNFRGSFDSYLKQLDEVIPEQVIQPAEQIKKLPEISDNYLKDLNNYSDTLYRETNAYNALELIDKNVLSDLLNKEFYFSNNKDLALGQGNNKGILLEFNSKGLKGQINTQKPTWRIEWENNNAEFIGKHNYKESYLNNIKSVTIKNNAILDKRDGKRLLRLLENGNWEKQILENGDVKYTKITQTIPKQPTKKVTQEITPKNIVDEVIPEQVIQPTGETKLRSLPQSVLEAKGTPKEVKEIIKQDMPTYQVLHNKDLTAQASNELAGNFDNELVRLASAKDFDALDYEKSRQIAKTLFDNGDYQRAVDLIDNVSENATKKGQAIQALSLWSNMSPEGAVYKAQKLVKEYNKKNPKKPIQLTDENIDTIRKLQSEALNTVDELERNQAMARSAKYMTDLIPKGFVKKLKAYRNIAMLLNPKTLGRNIVGNVVFNVTDTGSKGLAALIDRGLSKFTGQRTRVAPDLGIYGKGLVQGAKTGFKEALQGIDTRGLGQRYDLGSGRVFESKPMQALETALDVGLRTPDRAFYEATFAESVQNMMKAQGLKEPTQEILERAEQEALESVFQNKSNVSDFALGLRSGFNKIGTQDFGLGDVLIPYAQTPANLTQQAINYSPLGLIKGGWNLSKGDQRQASLDIARSLIGTGLIGGGYGLAKAGLTTPSQFDENYTRNKAIRENLQPLGIRPDQLGNMWYAPFQPMSSPIATGTAMAYGDNPIFAGLNTVVDQPYLQGITRGLRDLQEGNWADAGVNVISSIPSQFVPTFASQFAQSIDPYQRQTYDPNKLQYGLNSAIAKIPFASKTLPERIDITGQPVERYSSKGAKRLFDIFLNPTFINEKTDDPVLSELKYIYDQTKKTSHFMPIVKKTLDFTDVDGNKQKIKLTGRELSEYQRELGQRMYDEFNYVMDLPEYTNTDDYGKIELLEKAKKLVKDEVDNEMWNKKKQYKKSSYTKGN